MDTSKKICSAKEENDICKAEEENDQDSETNDEGIGGCDVEEITEEEERKVFFVSNKQQKMARRQRSLISRNRRNTGFNASIKRFRQRTMSMVSIVSTNFADSR